MGKSWKAAERRIARELGGDRSTSPVQNTKHGTNSDAVGVPEYLEVKNPKSDTTHEDLSELNDSARQYDREPVVFYENVGDSNPVKFVAMWLETYKQLRNPENPASVRESFQRGIVPIPDGKESFMVRHEVGRRVANSALVRDTIEKAQEEEREPVVIIQRKNSPKKATLIPLLED